MIYNLVSQPLIQSSLSPRYLPSKEISKSFLPRKNNSGSESFMSSNISFKGNFAQRIMLKPTIKKLENHLGQDEEGLFIKYPENNKFIETLKKTTDFLLSIKTTGRHSQLVKLAKLNSQYNTPEFFEKTEKLVTKARTIQKDNRFMLTHGNFDEFSLIERLNIEILKKKNVPTKNILLEIDNTSKLLSQKIQRTMNKLENNILFYHTNVKSGTIRMFENNRHTKSDFNVNRLLYGEKTAYHKMKDNVKNELLFSYRFTLNRRKDTLINALEDNFLDRNLTQVQKYIQLQNLKYKDGLKTAPTKSPSTY